MTLSHIIAAAALALAAGTAGAAQMNGHDQPPMAGHPMMHERTVVTTHRTSTVTHRGMGFHRPRCHIERHHHHNVRVCR